MTCGHLPRVKERKDVRMLQRRRDLDLPEKPLAPDYGGEFRLEHLDRDPPVVLQVFGEIDHCHPPATQLPLDPVVVGESSR
jgi:hypothetical protein